MDDSQIDAYLEEQFPTRSGMLYMNHAAISPWPRAASEAVTAFAHENTERGPLGVSQWLIRESRLRRSCADLLGCGDEDIAFLQNTSEGINVVVNGIDWKPGDNVVMPHGEYASNRLPWMTLANRGVEIREIGIRSTDNPESALLNALDGRSRVLTVSSVQWSDGLRLDLQRLGTACAGTGVFFFVDAIQQLGALRLDVTACHVDALAAGSHKWQMGPEGMGIFYCPAESRERLDLSRHGWRMLEDPYQFEREGRNPAGSARRFEAGSPNTLGQAALAGSLSVIEALGLQAVESRILSNTDRLGNGLRSMPGARLVSSTDSNRRSGIVSFASAHAEPGRLRSLLVRKGVYAAVRGHAVRLSPHFYQGDDHMDRVLNAIEDSLDSD